MADKDVDDEIDRLGDLLAGGVGRIAHERRRQIEQEGFSAEHDDGHDDGSLGVTAAIILDRSGLLAKHKGNRIRQLEIAGALVAAELDRLLRRSGTSNGEARQYEAER